MSRRVGMKPFEIPNDYEFTGRKLINSLQEGLMRVTGVHAEHLSVQPGFANRWGTLCKTKGCVMVNLKNSGGSAKENLFYVVDVTRKSLSTPPLMRPCN